MNEQQALALMHRGARLVLTHTEEGDKWSIEPQGKWVLPTTAANIINRPEIKPSHDSLFDDAKPQTWAADTGDEKAPSHASAEHT